MDSINYRSSLWSFFPYLPKWLRNFHLSGSALKWIAIIAMFVDHTAIAIMERTIRLESFTHKVELHKVYKMCRHFGRLGFPIFCFLLVEGLVHTKSRFKYALRLFLFCLISEVPFDLALFNSWIATDHQNVFFTLLIGYLTIWAIDELYHRFKDYPYAYVLMPMIVGAAYYLANTMHTDYRGYGVLAIVVMYLFRFNYLYSLFVGLIVLYGFNSSELQAFFAMIPVSFYNGTRGKQFKYFFYSFYPAHLAVLYILAVLFHLT